MTTARHHLVLVALRRVAPLLMVALFSVSAGLLYRTFRHNPWDRIGHDLLGLGVPVVVAALVATVASYAAMTGYDALALRYVQHPLPYRRFALASFVATAFGNNLGASAFVGAALRARVYSTWKVPGFAITRIIGFNLVTLALGAAVLAGGGMVTTPEKAGQALHVPTAAAFTIGALLLLSVVGYLAWARTGGRAVAWRDWRIDRPSRGLAGAQVLLSTVEWMTMAAALYVLLPAGGRIPFMSFAAAFSIATAAGLVSNVPGGLGVFESTLVVMIGHATPPAQLAVALVAYRLCYFVLPLLVAAVLLVVHESRRAASATTRRSADISVLTPSVLALAVAGMGAFMLLFGDLPGDTRAQDVSAFTTSLAGALALVVARGLHRRLRGAWWCTVALLAVVITLASFHGEPVLASAACVVLLLMLPARPAFYRRCSASVRAGRFVWPAVAAALIGAALWWHEFGGPRTGADSTLLAAPFTSGTPGLARLAIVVGAVGLLISGRRMLAPTAPDPAPVTDDQLADVGRIVAANGDCSSNLAFTGDKRFHFSRDATAFLMYQIEGRSWVAMGDPVGEPEAFRELITTFVERADRHACRPVFYSVREHLADLYRECGLTLVKLGENAVIPLETFTLDGKSRQGLRNCRNKSVKSGVTIEFVPQPDVVALLPQLRIVSDAWLGDRNGREKRFSLGAFDDEYVSRFPVVVLRQEGRVIAFATLWFSGDGQEMQIDLMRRLPDSPRTVMTYLFVECIMWAKENGFTSFHLGMAPLSGLCTEATSPFWEKVGHLMWKHGEQFYNFKGLRTFKEGFSPEWQTRYVAAPGGPALPTSMLNVATLVGGGGGLRGLVRS